MQYANTIRDASRVGDPLVNGYWCLGAHHWKPGHSSLSHREKRGNAVTLPVQLPVQDVAQAAGPVKLWLVVPTYTFIRNNKEERWMLLTRVLIDQHVGPRQVRYDYALRWRAEDGKRFLGQIWHFERFMTRSLLALERMLWCVCLAGGFVAMPQREEPELCEQLESEVLYHSKPCKIPGYRTARGIQAAAARTAGVPMLNNA